MPDPVIHELISAYVDGELTPQECAQVEQMLDSSEEFRGYYDDLLEVSQRVAGLPQFTLGPNFESRVMSAIRNEAPKSRPAATIKGRKRHWRIAVLAVATAAAIALTIALRPSDQPENVAGGGADEPFPTTFVSAQPNFMMVYEISLTADGVSRESFASALGAAKIDFDSAIPVDAKLKDQLMKNRFFGPDGGPVGETPEPAEAQQPRTVPFQLVYVVGRGRQIDEVHDFLLGEKRANAIEWLKMDVAAYPGDFDFFKHVHRASDLQLAKAASQPSHVLRVRAQRMAMEMVFQTKLGQGLRTLSVPAMGLLQSAVVPGDAPARRRPNSQLAERFKEMEEMTFGVLFVIRSPVSN